MLTASMSGDATRSRQSEKAKAHPGPAPRQQRFTVAAGQRHHLTPGVAAETRGHGPGRRTECRSHRYGPFAHEPEERPPRRQEIPDVDDRFARCGHAGVRLVRRTDHQKVALSNDFVKRPKLRISGDERIGREHLPRLELSSFLSL